MLSTITPDTSHGDLWLYLSNQVPDSIQFYGRHFLLFMLLSQPTCRRLQPTNDSPQFIGILPVCPQVVFAISFTCTAWVAARGGLQCFDNLSKLQRFLCRLYTLHTGSHQFILLTRKDLAASESGFSSEDIYTTMRNPPHLVCTEVQCSPYVNPSSIERQHCIF